MPDSSSVNNASSARNVASPLVWLKMTGTSADTVDAAGMERMLRDGGAVHGRLEAAAELSALSFAIVAKYARHERDRSAAPEAPRSSAS